MSVDGWERLLKISESDIRGASEDTIDELYAFLLTNKLQDSSVVSTHPDQLKKLLATVQTVLRVSKLNHYRMYYTLQYCIHNYSQCCRLVGVFIHTHYVVTLPSMQSGGCTKMAFIN